MTCGWRHSLDNLNGNITTKSFNNAHLWVNHAFNITSAFGVTQGSFINVQVTSSRRMTMRSMIMEVLIYRNRTEMGFREKEWLVKVKVNSIMTLLHLILNLLLSMICW